jgi:chemotaxis family two-component system sensor kinase Cph1
MTGMEISELDYQLAAAEQLRLLECAQELIHLPGAIQSHGALLLVDSATGDIVRSSANSGELLGSSVDELLGTNVFDMPGLAPSDLSRSILSGNENPVAVTVDGVGFDAIIHAAGERSTVEFEPLLRPFDIHSSSSMFEAILRLSQSASIEELWANTAREVLGMTGFDRVMVYHFHPDQHGEIVGEEHAEGMEPYFGLHYPASDIPSQARQLYLSKLSRVIANSEDVSVALVSRGDDGGTVDLSQAELRAVSPHHLQFMRNMGQASSVSLSLVHDGQLIGMITCAHRTPRRLAYAVRQGLEILASQVALQLSSMRSIAALTRQVEVRSIRSRLLGQVSESLDISDALLRGDATILDLIPADGAATRTDGHTSSIGATPSAEVMADVLSYLWGQSSPAPLVSDSLARHDLVLAAMLPGVAGMILLPLGGDGNYVAWFRREIVATVSWLGDLTDGNRLTPLSPRNSFTSWSQSVTGKSAPWDGIEVEAAELARDLDGVLLRRAESTLAKLALHDPLTGLPNRRLLTDRLEHALAKYARGEELALLFIDIDRFKSINDEYGHDAGDSALIHAATQIRAATRAQDTVARLGGDEFVVLCENTTAEEADLISVRVLASLREPFIVGEDRLSLTASVGVTGANLNFSAAQLLRDADTAMYRAKTRGRDQASR